MADNPTVDNGSLTDYTVAADDDGTALHQYVKLEFGADNTQTKVSTTDPLPVTGTVDLGTTDNAVLDAIAASVAAIDIDATTIIGHVDGIEALIGTTNTSLTTIAGAVAGTEMQVDVVAALPAGTNAIGKLAANSGVDIGDVDVTSLPGAAHDAAISGNPVRIAARALSADYPAVAAGDTADLITTLLGKLVVYPYANPNQMWSYAAPAGGLVNQTAVTIKAAAGGGIRNYITHIDVVNSHATISTELIINDGAAGTVLWRGWLQAAGGGYSINFDPPLRGTANTLLEIDEITATGTTGVLFNCVGFTAAE